MIKLHIVCCSLNEISSDKYPCSLNDEISSDKNRDDLYKKEACNKETFVPLINILRGSD